MSIFFASPEQAFEHYKQDHGVDFEYERTARRFDGTNGRGYHDILDAAFLLHNQNYFATAADLLYFFEKPWKFTDEVWAAAAGDAGVDLDECPDCD